MKKNIAKALLISAATLIGACSTHSEIPNYPINETKVLLTEDTTTVGLVFPDYSSETVNPQSGNYQYPVSEFFYKRYFESWTEDINPLEELTILYRKGIKVRQAWYRHSLCSCSSGGWTNGVAYKAELYILLDAKNDSIVNYNYSKVTYPDIKCGYNVNTYVLQGE